jgi:hypothetical protein
LQVRVRVLSRLADLPQLSDFVGAKHLNASTMAGYLWCLMQKIAMGLAAAHCACQSKTFAALQSADGGSVERKKQLGLNKLEPTPFPVYSGDLLDLYSYGTQHLHLEGIKRRPVQAHIQTYPRTCLQASRLDYLAVPSWF